MFALLDTPEPYSRIEGAWRNDALTSPSTVWPGTARTHGLFRCAADYCKAISRNVERIPTPTTAPCSICWKRTASSPAARSMCGTERPGWHTIGRQTARDLYAIHRRGPSTPTARKGPAHDAPGLLITVSAAGQPLTPDPHLRRPPDQLRSNSSFSPQLGQRISPLSPACPRRTRSPPRRRGRWSRSTPRRHPRPRHTRRHRPPARRGLLHLAQVVADGVQTVLHVAQLVLQILELPGHIVQHVDDGGNELALLGLGVQSQPPRPDPSDTLPSQKSPCLFLLSKYGGPFLTWPGRVLAGTGVDTDLITDVDEQGHLHLSAGLHSGGLEGCWWQCCRPDRARSR